MERELNQAERAVGEIAARALMKIEDLLPEVAGTKYTYLDMERYQQLLLRDIGQAMHVYWSEIVARAHFTASATLMRTSRWMRGVVEAHSSGNLLVLAAALRGLIEAVADSWYTLNQVGGTFSKEFYRIRQALKGRAKAIYHVEGLEDRLIHFMYARRLDRGEEAPEGHRARTTAKYLESLGGGIFAAETKEVYGRLCQMTHPAAHSILGWLQPLSGIDGEQWVLVPGDEKAAIERLMRPLRVSLIRGLCETGFNPALIVLWITNRLPLPEYHCGSIDELRLDGIEMFDEARRRIEGVGSEQNL